MSSCLAIFSSVSFLLQKLFVYMYTYVNLFLFHYHSHPGQVPGGWDALIIAGIGFAELQRAKTGWVDPADVKFDQAGALNSDYYPGDIGFDPLGLKPEDPEELDIMITKELQNGRLAMLAAAGFLAQEAVDGKGILEHFSS